jgi:hypothetical protein
VQLRKHTAHRTCYLSVCDKHANIVCDEHCIVDGVTNVCSKSCTMLCVNTLGRVFDHYNCDTCACCAESAGPSTTVAVTAAKVTAAESNGRVTAVQQLKAASSRTAWGKVSHAMLTSTLQCISVSVMHSCTLKTCVLTAYLALMCTSIHCTYVQPAVSNTALM